MHPSSECMFNKGQRPKKGVLTMSYVRRVIESTINSTPREPEFHQAVEEVLSCLETVLERNPKYEEAAILERIVEPDRSIIFRVP